MGRAVLSSWISKRQSILFWTVLPKQRQPLWYREMEPIQRASWVCIEGKEQYCWGRSMEWKWIRASLERVSWWFIYGIQNRMEQILCCLTRGTNEIEIASKAYGAAFYSLKHLMWTIFRKSSKYFKAHIENVSSWWWW